jgi:putative transposase
MNKIHPVALFRLSVLGPLASRDRFERGELKRIIRALAQQSYDIPDSNRNHLSEKAIEKWYYLWKRGGIDALVPKLRCDLGQTKMKSKYQEAILQCKKENKKRSISQIKRILEISGIVALGELSRSSIHRFLKSFGLSRYMGDVNEPIEHRTFCTQHAGDIWYGDVLHGPTVPVGKRLRKVYLVSLMDDASRLITHSAFCLGETALDIEGVLKQACLRRGLPKKLVVDNGAAYRSKSLQGICARLEIRLIYCRPYSPEGKGKLERWHRTVRATFLNELDTRQLRDLDDLNARLWAWIENEYHKNIHSSLEKSNPLQRWQKDLLQIRPLGSFADKLEEIFFHRHKRTVRKDGTISYDGKCFEVPYELVGKKVFLVVSPHDKKTIRVESETGVYLGAVTPLDAIANINRKRVRPRNNPPDITDIPRTFNMVELSLEDYEDSLKITANKEEDE